MSADPGQSYAVGTGAGFTLHPRAHQACRKHREVSHLGVGTQGACQGQLGLEGSTRSTGPVAD